MPVINCPNGHSIRVGDQHVGQLVKCPTCQASFVANGNGQGGEFAELSGGGSTATPRGGKAVAGLSGLVGMVNSFVGKPLLFVGLFLVVLGRGCDATSMRAASRSEAQYRQLRVPFQMEWDTKLATAQQNIEKKNRQMHELNANRFKKDAGDPAELQKRSEKLNEEMTALNKEQTKLREDYQTALFDKEHGDWKPTHEAALSAVNHHRMWGYWFEMVFIFGTMVLLAGILTLAFTGQGAERWVAYIMIAIITFSIYVGGAAWIESIVTSTTSNIPGSGGGGGPLGGPRFEEKGPRFP